MADITCLGYAVYGVSDLDAWEDFSVNILGLQVGRREEDMLTLRMDQYEQRIILEKSFEDDLTVAGWEFDNESELEQFVQKVNTLTDVQIINGGKELAKRRRVEKVYIIDDGNVKTGSMNDVVGSENRSWSVLLCLSSGRERIVSHMLTHGIQYKIIDFAAIG